VEFDNGTYIWGTLRDQHRPEGGEPPIPRAPIGIEEREDFRAALSDGEGFIVKINRPFSCLRFGPDVFNSVAENEFLIDLINVLHLVLSRHDIMVDAAEILRSGIECTGIQLDPNMPWIYLVNVNFPTQHGSIKFACACRTIGRGHECVHADVTATVLGQLSPLPKEIELRTTGNVHKQSGLGSTGYLLVVNMLRKLEDNLRRNPGDPTGCTEQFQIEAQPGSCVLKSTRSRVLPAITEVMKQACAINNWRHSGVTATYEATVYGFLVEIIVNSQGRAPIRLKWSSNLLKLIPDKKQRAGHFGETFLYPFFSQNVLELTCSEWNAPPDQARSLPCPHHERCSNPNKKYEERIAYLHVWMRDNGLVCTAPTVTEMLRMAEIGGDVEVIFAPVWDRLLMFLYENKNRFLDLSEDLFRTLSLLVKGTSPSLKMQFDRGQFKDSFPHTAPLGELRFSSLDSNYMCRITRDHAGQNILGLFCSTPGRNDRPEWQKEWQKPAQAFGGIRLQRNIQDGAQIQENGEADERGDDSPIEGCDGGHIVGSKDAISEGDFDGEDAINEDEYDSGSGDDESSEGSVGAPCGAARHRNPPRSPPRSPAGEAPASEATQGSNFALKRQNASSQDAAPPVILQSSLCFWRC
jgi:hypothetical protein